MAFEKPSIVTINSSGAGEALQFSAWTNGEAVFHMVPVLIKNINPSLQHHHHQVNHPGANPSSAVIHPALRSGNGNVTIDCISPPPSIGTSNELQILGDDSCSPAQMMVTTSSLQNALLATSPNHHHNHHHHSHHHSSTVVKEKKHECSFCEKRFTHRHHLKTHEKTHTNELEHACSFCERRFNRKDVLQVHERSHTGEKPYKCRFCDEVFSDCRMRTRHETRAHPNKQYICELCGEIFGLDRRQFSSHMKKTHRSTVYRCEFCSLSFMSSRLLQGHVQTHHQIKEERIEVVAEEIHEETPEIHMIIRESEALLEHNETLNHPIDHHRSVSSTSASSVAAAYRCTFCSRGFSRKDCWKKHERAHTGEKPYKCRFCTEVFACTTARSRHELKFHQGEKYRCEICKQQFPNKQMYNSHMKFSHPDETQLRCGICAKRFKEHHELNRHVQSIHSSHEERLMRACSSLLPSPHIDRTSGIMEDKGTNSNSHFMAQNILEPSVEHELFEA